MATLKSDPRWNLNTRAARLTPSRTNPESGTVNYTSYDGNGNYNVVLLAVYDVFAPAASC